MPLRVTIWHEFRHEKRNPAVGKVYPNGIHAVIKEGIQKYIGTDDVEITLAALDDPHQGLPEALLDNTDVMLWWGHGYHPEVDDHLAARVAGRVRNGMGLIVLHSGPLREGLPTADGHALPPQVA